MTNDYQRFLDSMNIDYYKGHDGVGYALDTLRQLSLDEQKKVEDILIACGLKDWRDIEALAEIGSENAFSAIKDALKSSKFEVRMSATEKLAQNGILSEGEIERVLVETIPSATILNGLVFTLRLAENYATPAVRRVLLWCALYGNDDIRVHAAALICYLYGFAESPFDWKHRPFYLRFGDKTLSKRKLAYNELCKNIQVDPQWAMDERA